MTAVVAAGVTMVAPPHRQATAAPSASGAVTVEGFSFKPQTLEVKVGAKVTWMNNDDVTHTATSGTPDQRTNEFNQTLQGKGAKFEFTFSKTGKFAYFCARHNSMRGEITVTP